jgi:eukaryotic-like serine/threonine-protein kinase
LMFLLALSVSPAIFVQVIYFGIFSAAQLFPALALFFFSRRERFRPALLMFSANAILQAGCAALIISGVVADPGLVRPTLPASTLVVGHVLTQLGFFCAFLLGRGSYKASRDAIVRMQSAARLAAQREALLDEARDDLDRALQIDSAGRFTDRVFGHYRIGHVIGRGGMGEVYEARHIATGDAAAVKLLSQRELGNPHSVARFVREVGVIRDLESPHVVRVLAASTEGEPVPYLVMELLSGDDLAHHLRGGKLPHEGLDELLRQVGAALEEAWSHGVVHRDLKPQNLFLADRPGATPIWKVLDFGIAALDEGSGTLTQGKVVGTPSYMAPEQARGERVDHRADVYALAAIAYRWLTGRPVVAGRDLHTALYQTVHVMPDRPSWLADLSADVDRALAIGLSKDAALRYATVEELRVALDAAFDNELSSALRSRGDEILSLHPWGAVRA